MSFKKPLLNLVTRYVNLVKQVKNYVLSNGLTLGNAKTFCIGRNKTGTTSLKRALSDWGYNTGNQKEAELYINFYKQKNFRPLVQYCKSFDAFQDAPFSWPFTFIAMDQAFPGSKFILTVRDSPEQWYQSIVKFHGKLFSDGTTPTVSDLKEAKYRYKGWIWEVIETIYNTPKNDPYNEEIMIQNYIQHNNMVKEYFRMRPNDLLVLNPAQKNAYVKLANFLGEEPLYDKMPWENKTENISS